jgi:hypothetical protein
VLARLHVVGHAFNVVERAMLAPDLARLAGHADVGLPVLSRDGYDKAIYVSHDFSVLENSVSAQNGSREPAGDAAKVVNEVQELQQPRVG